MILNTFQRFDCTTSRETKDNITNIEEKNIIRKYTLSISIVPISYLLR